ncbi:MAG: ATP-binding cassette domain-containing protein [Myxococcota bacterium]
MSLEALIWPAARAGDAIVAAAEAAGFETRREPTGPPPEGKLSEPWLEDAARWLGVELEPVVADYPDVPALVQASAPALIRVEGGLLAVARASRAHLELLSPAGGTRRVPASAVVELLTAPKIQAIAPEIEGIIAAAQIPSGRHPALRASMLQTRLRHAAIEGVALLRRPIDLPLSQQAQHLRLIPRLGALAGLHLFGYLCLVLSWLAIGRTMLSGRVDRGWLGLWALLLATGVLVRLGASFAAGQLAIQVSASLRARLLTGALRLSPDRVRGEGVGRSLGRIFESSALETLAVSGGFTAMFALTELTVVLVVLALGSAGLLQVALLLLLLGASAALVRGYVRARGAWTEERLAITHELIDAMNGHATRLVQQPLADRHTAEDQALARYVRRSEELDRRVTWLQAAVPRGWLVLASLCLAPSLLFGQAEVSSLATSFFGMLLGYGALLKLADAATRLTDAAISWRSVAPLVSAGGEPRVRAAPAIAHAPPSSGQPLAAVRALVYRAPRASVPLLSGCELSIAEGDRLLLLGPSGAGKSTLAQLLGGLRRPDNGLVLAGGLDRSTLGERGWQRRIAMVPQFHDNHVFFGPLAFNLLMGRGWPTSAHEIEVARALCEELGLGPTIARMPDGLFQLVGETGWQLSHGEQSRVFLARALLSGAPLVVLDESLAALDPDTLMLAIRCIERRASAALVIAHP